MVDFNYFDGFVSDGSRFKMPYLARRLVSELLEMVKENPYPPDSVVRQLAGDWHVKQSTIQWWIVRHREAIYLSDDNEVSNNAGIVEIKVESKRRKWSADLSNPRDAPFVKTNNLHSLKSYKQQSIKSFFHYSTQVIGKASSEHFQHFDALADYSGYQWQPVVLLRNMNLKCSSDGCPNCERTF